MSYELNIGEPNEAGALHPAADHILEGEVFTSPEEAMARAEEFAGRRLRWTHKLLGERDERWQALIRPGLGAEIELIGPPARIRVSVGAMR